MPEASCGTVMPWQLWAACCITGRGWAGMYPPPEGMRPGTATGTPTGTPTGTGTPICTGGTTTIGGLPGFGGNGLGGHFHLLSGQTLSIGMPMIGLGVFGGGGGGSFGG